MRQVFAGGGAGAAVSLLAFVVGFVLTEMDGDPLRPVVRGVLVGCILVGPVVAGAVTGRDRSNLEPVLAGALSLLLVTAFAVVRQVVDDEDPMLSLLVAGAILGALLGLVGGALRGWTAARTRR